MNKMCNLECLLDKETRTCVGCGRTLEEIAYTGRLKMNRVCEENLLTDEEE